MFPHPQLLRLCLAGRSVSELREDRVRLSALPCLWSESGGVVSQDLSSPCTDCGIETLPVDHRRAECYDLAEEVWAASSVKCHLHFCWQLPVRYADSHLRSSRASRTNATPRGI
jgi:hypothetical protein